MGHHKLASPVVVLAVCFIVFRTLTMVWQFNSEFCTIADGDEKSTRNTEDAFKQNKNQSYHDSSVENQTMAVFEVNIPSASSAPHQDVSPTLRPVDVGITVELIAREVARIEKSFRLNQTDADQTDKTIQKILLCKEFSSIKDNVSKMTYITQKDDEAGHLFVQRQSREKLNASIQSGVETAKKTIFKLLRTHTWYGVEKLRGLCMLSLTGTDVVQHIMDGGGEVDPNLENLKVVNISYIVTRAVGVPLCNSNSSKEECKRLYSVIDRVKASSKPGLAALTLMLNTAKLFERFWFNGVVVSHFSPDTLRIGPNFEVTVSNINLIKFLPENSNGNSTKYQRILSGTICKRSEDCPPLPRGRGLSVFEYAPDCAEVSGMCWLENECWGIDSHTHACLLSRWLFSRLHALVPAFWSHEGELTKLLRCGHKQLPDERCNWTTLREGLNALVQKAEEDWT